MLVKVHGSTPEGQRRYSPAECIGAVKHRVEGNPDPNHVSTSYAERQNLNIRMGNRRMTRLTNAFSKKAPNHAHMMAIYFMHRILTGAAGLAGMWYRLASRYILCSRSIALRAL